jgi:hypothetical protein
MKRPRRGNERTQKVRYVRRQEGSEGCRVAQLSDVMMGWAREVSGATAARAAGKVFSSVKSVGETNGL